MNGREKKAKAAKDPIQNPQYIYQYKIQNIVPKTFSNTESIAQEESLHNQLKKINHYPSTVEGGGGFINQFPTLVGLPQSLSSQVWGDIGIPLKSSDI